MNKIIINKCDNRDSCKCIWNPLCPGREKGPVQENSGGRKKGTIAWETISEPMAN